MLDSVTSKLKLAELLSLTKTEQILRLAEINAELEQLTAQQRVEWALENLPGNHVVSSSFGIQAALMLHLMTQAKPDIPVILTDTGYLFSETYRFIDLLSERLTLNLKVYRSGQSLIGKKPDMGNFGNKV
ncbi:phosphoadenylyl-sulfate reductase [Vibrio astriarenae]|nr:phosphoadenylyl-sulfate reductase [Vibrio sp. C7]